ncbi:AraC family transcriptional regulator [Clostridium chromiireducens]|uniref:Arabinose operon regulatory protein n=1 Tax=Clostridium chromiireducens TaxID=225345 RepID=A0A1V4J0W1_9CLOT|nr:AraC family transcriptional regulator [Clostridium chromiireducens]OPJ65730.1 arabinose operon regulatory protein [Clostridium chromiireducens]
MNMVEIELNPYLVYCLYDESIATQTPGKEYKSRVTRYHELEFITNGSGTMKVNDTVYNLKQGDLFYYPPDTKITGTMPYGYILIIFDPYFNQKNFLQYQEGRKALGDDLTCESNVSMEALPIPLHINVSNFNIYKSIFKKIFTSFVRDGNTLENKIVLLQLLFELKTELSKTSNIDSFSTKSYYKKIMKCLKNIDTTPETNYSLNELATEVELSKNFLCTAFKEIVGVTIFSYIHEKRIEKAKAMLIETQSSIEEIAHHCGFENMSYFYRMFKRYTGASPSNYRQHYRL